MFDTVKGCVKIGFGIAVGFTLERAVRTIILHVGEAILKSNPSKSAEVDANTNAAEEESAE